MAGSRLKLSKSPICYNKLGMSYPETYPFWANYWNVFFMSYVCSYKARLNDSYDYLPKEFSCK